MANTIFSGDKVRALRNALQLSTSASLVAGAVNPSSVAPGISVAVGSIYMSTSTGKAYVKHTAAGDDTNWSELVVSADISALLSDVADLTTLSGVASNATDLGTFTGTTIPDTSTVKAALQSLETSVETKAASSVVTEIDQNVDDLITLSGVAENATSLGTFTGTTIPDTSTVKAALQALETEVELKLDASEKGANSGVATLDAGGKVPASQLPNSVMEYKGTFDATTGTPALADGTGNAGDVYVVSVGGTYDFGAGNITFVAGDWVMYSGSIYEKSVNSNSVASVNGATGVVTVNAINELTGDITAGPATGSQSKVATLAALVVTNSHISNSAAITRSKLAAGTANSFAINNASGELVSEVVTGNRALATTIDGIPVASTTTDVELGYVAGVTSAIQTQIGDIATDVADLVTLSGVAANEPDLGTFTGTTIPNDSTIKAALQALETSVETKAADSAVIKKDGSVAFTADQSMGGNQLTSVGAPAAGTDAANRDTVDAGDATGSSNLTLVASGTIAPSTTHTNQVIVVQGNAAGTVTLSTTPFGAFAGKEGQIITLIGNSATNLIQIDNNNASNGCIMNASWVSGLYDSITFIYSATLGRFVEIGRNN